MPFFLILCYLICYDSTKNYEEAKKKMLVIKLDLFIFFDFPKF